MSKKIEIERKFLVKHDALQDKDIVEMYRIQQGYIAKNKNGAVRIRIEENEEKGTVNAYLMSKVKINDMSNIETTDEITVEAAKLLLFYFPEKVIDKTRFVVMHNGNKWEIDLFKSPNRGLLLAEIELESETQEFEMPPWVVKEVTGQPEYYNANM